MRAPGLALLLALVGALSGCGQPPPAAPPPAAAPVPDESVLRDAPIVGGGALAGLTSTPWRLVDVAPSGRVLVVRADQGGGCDRPVGLTVAETARSVTIRSVLRVDATAGPCLAYRSEPRWRVVLARPLGARSLLHGPLGAIDAGRRPR